MSTKKRDATRAFQLRDRSIRGCPAVRAAQGGSYFFRPRLSAGLFSNVSAGDSYSLRPFEGLTGMTYGRGAGCSRGGVMWPLEQDRGRADIRSERGQGGRSERSGGNMPVACLPGKLYFGTVPLQKRLAPCVPPRGAS